MTKPNGRLTKRQKALLKAAGWKHDPRYGLKQRWERPPMDGGHFSHVIRWEPAHQYWKHYSHGEDFTAPTFAELWVEYVARLLTQS